MSRIKIVYNSGSYIRSFYRASLDACYCYCNSGRLSVCLSVEGVKQRHPLSKTIIWVIRRSNSETVRDRVWVSRLLFTNRKSHTGFRSLPNSVTLSDLERRRHYALFHIIRQLSKQNVSNSLQQQNCSPRSLVFGNMYGLRGATRATSVVAELLVTFVNVAKNNHDWKCTFDCRLMHVFQRARF